MSDRASPGDDVVIFSMVADGLSFSLLVDAATIQSIMQGNATEATVPARIYVTKSDAIPPGELGGFGIPAERVTVRPASE